MSNLLVVLAGNDCHHDILANVNVHRLAVNMLELVHATIGDLLCRLVVLSRAHICLATKPLHHASLPYRRALLEDTVFERIVEVGGILSTCVCPSIPDCRTLKWDLEVGVEDRVREVGDVLSRETLARDICLRTPV